MIVKVLCRFTLREGINFVPLLDIWPGERDGLKEISSTIELKFNYLIKARTWIFILVEALIFVLLAA